MPKSLSQRVKDSFPDDEMTSEQTRSDAIEYCKELRTAWLNVNTSLNRAVLSMFAIAVVFELFAVDNVDKVTITGFEITKITTIRAFLPVALGYLYLNVALLIQKSWSMGRLHAQCMRLAYPKLADNQLDSWLAPPFSLALTLGAGVRPEIAKRAENFNSKLLLAIAMMSILTPPLFEIYAFFILFQKKTNLYLYISVVVVTILLTGVALRVLIHWTYDEDVDEMHR